mmetsp:Transcript_3895/g.9434  ORF Transcript_3895/g.9434 Transcript_3895/m.9434 type:complete len:183 (+) Transcript_3895:366-914(+)
MGPLLADIHTRARLLMSCLSEGVAVGAAAKTSAIFAASPLSSPLAVALHSLVIFPLLALTFGVAEHRRLTSSAQCILGAALPAVSAAFRNPLPLFDASDFDEPVAASRRWGAEFSDRPTRRVGDRFSNDIVVVKAVTQIVRVSYSFFVVNLDLIRNPLTRDPVSLALPPVIYHSAAIPATAR